MLETEVISGFPLMPGHKVSMICYRILAAPEFYQSRFLDLIFGWGFQFLYGWNDSLADELFDWINQSNADEWKLLEPYTLFEGSSSSWLAPTQNIWRKLYEVGYREEGVVMLESWIYDVQLSDLETDLTEKRHLTALVASKVINAMHLYMIARAAALCVNCWPYEPGRPKGY